MYRINTEYKIYALFEEILSLFRINFAIEKQLIRAIKIQRASFCVHPVAHFPLRNGFAISRKYSFRSAFPNDSVILSKFGQKRKIYYSVAGNKTLGHRSFWAPE